MQTNTKYKRGQKFTIIETGEEITLNRIKENGEYFCDFDNGSYQSFHPDELKPVTKGKKPISSKPKKLTKSEKSDKDDLNLFFDTLAIPAHCQECGDMLMAFNKFAKRSVCCHILPKSKFESIATNPLNILFMGADFLGGCSDHDFWDKSVGNRKKMNVYQLAIERFELLKPSMTSSEIIEAYKYLGIPLTKEILNQIK